MNRKTISGLDHLDIEDRIKETAATRFLDITRRHQVKAENRIKIIYGCIFDAYLIEGMYCDELELAEKLSLSGRKVNSAIERYYRLSNKSLDLATLSPYEILDQVVMSTKLNDSHTSHVREHLDTLIERCPKVIRSGPRAVALAVTLWYIAYHELNTDKKVILDNRIKEVINSCRKHLP